MTNEQVIGALNRIRCIIREDSIEEQALVYAIEVLTAQPNLQSICNQLATDCISRQVALNLFPDDNLYWDINEGYFAPHYAKTLLRNLPLVQSDIIHCKDCAYCGSDVVDAPYGLTKKIWWCDRMYEEANENLTVEPDDFCSWAERRQDG